MVDSINIFKDIRQTAKENNQEEAAETQRPDEDFTNLEKRAAEVRQMQQLYLKVCEEYQENIKKSQWLRSDINKLIKDGASLQEITSKAIECIGLMTGDRLFVDQNIKGLEKYK